MPLGCFGKCQNKINKISIRVLFAKSSNRFLKIPELSYEKPSLILKLWFTSECTKETLHLKYTLFVFRKAYFYIKTNKGLV